MTNNVVSLSAYKELSERETVNIIGGKKRHWYTPIIDFGQGFLDAF